MAARQANIEKKYKECKKRCPKVMAYADVDTLF